MSHRPGSLRHPLRLALLAVAGFGLAFAPHAPARVGDPDAARASWAAHHPALEPNELIYRQHAYPTGVIDPDKVAAAYQQARMDRAAAALTLSSSTLPWVSAGPTNVGGRITAMAVVSGGNVIYIGSANGGVFKSVDGGVNWSPVFDAVSVPSIGAVSLDPTNANTVYVGTGESNASVDSYDGAGVFRSTDAGVTWQYLGLAETRRIGAVAVDPSNPSRIYVAAMGPQFSTDSNRGLYRSEDGGAHWSRMLYVSDSTGVTDIAINPLHPDTVFCATWERVRRPTYRRAYGPECGIWRSIDHGTTWTRLLNGMPVPSDDVGRIGLAISPTRPRWIYAQIIQGATLGYNGLGMWRSTDGGDSWVKRDNPANITFANGFGGFGWYFGEDQVDPVDPNVVYSAGQVYMRSSDGGVTFGSFNFGLHPDVHAIWVDPTNTLRVYTGTDGGFYKTVNGGGGWVKSIHLPISQFYAGAIDPNNPTRLLGGTQDNDCLQTNGNPDDWQSMNFQADGFVVLVDPTDPTITFGEYQYGSYGAGPFRSTSYGGSGTFAAPSGFSPSDRYNWCMPYCISPTDHNVMLAGSQRVYKSVNNGVSYSVASGDLTRNLLSSLTYSTISALDISGPDPNTYYAGTDDGKVSRSTNAGATWTDITAGLPIRYVTHVVADPVAAATVFVTLSGFGLDEHVPHIYRSTDRGTSWTAIDGNLPDAPVNDVVVDPANTQHLFAATDVGVYCTNDLGNYWYPFGQGMPLQPVMDLSYNPATHLLAAATHGRSQWKIDATDYLAGVPAGPAAGRLRLTPPVPDPFRTEVRFTLETPSAGRAQVDVFDAQGRRVRALFAGSLPAGRRDFTWDGRDARGVEAPAGVYLVRAGTGTYAPEVKHLVKLR
ncbi:MAG: FlgD immunoglobulin-like domain containing protein [Candidatus Eisenbacteria bacterium]